MMTTTGSSSSRQGPTSEGQQQQQQRDVKSGSSLTSATHSSSLLPTTTTTTTTTMTTASSSMMIRPDDDLPTNVSTISQLQQLPSVCLNNDIQTRDGGRPLRHVDDLGNEYYYSLTPLTYSVAFILTVELLERFSFYSIYYTMTLFLTGEYNSAWNAGFASVKAASFVSISTMVAYTTPFVGAFFADSLFGDYKSILFGMLCFYLPGIFIIALTTVPSLFGTEEFNDKLLTLGVLVLWPLGTGIVKSTVNVFGAKQYHPVLQSSLIESYYVSFYTTINVGALTGIIIIPFVAKYNITVAYTVPLLLLTGGVVSFLLGTPRYVKTPPRNRSTICQFGLSAASAKQQQQQRQIKQQQQHVHPVTLSPIAKKQKTIGLFQILRISVLIVPFCVGYNQMPTTFIVQGTVMKDAFGFINVASLNSLDAVSVLFFGYITASYIYPALNSRGIKIPTTYKFAIGSFLGSCAICWAIFVEYLIHSTYETTGEHVNVLWQSPAYILIGFGEIFAVSAAYEVAFTASPPDKKVLASATNIFCVGGLPNMICIVLYHSCSHWFANDRGTTNITYLEDYATAHVGKYFLVLLGIMGLGIFINVLPSVRRYVESIEEKASDLVKTPRIGKSPPLRRQDIESTDEGTPLVVTPRTRKYQKYLEYGSGPTLNRSGSMRAGPSLSRSDLPGGHVKHIKYKMIPKLYRGSGGGGRSRNATEGTQASRIHVATDAHGRPIRAGELASVTKNMRRQHDHDGTDRQKGISKQQQPWKQPKYQKRAEEETGNQGLHRHNSLT